LIINNFTLENGILRQVNRAEDNQIQMFKFSLFFEVTQNYQTEFLLGEQKISRGVFDVFNFPFQVVYDFFKVSGFVNHFFKPIPRFVFIVLFSKIKNFKHQFDMLAFIASIDFLWRAVEWFKVF
jgi:hypothetical protein